MADAPDNPRGKLYELAEIAGPAGMDDATAKLAFSHLHAETLIDGSFGHKLSINREGILHAEALSREESRHPIVKGWVWLNAWPLATHAAAAIIGAVVYALLAAWCARRLFRCQSLYGSYSLGPAIITASG